jgi:hypothetical protein
MLRPIDWAPFTGAQSNLLEYALATDPETPGRDGTVAGDVSGDHFQLHFHRNVSATDVTCIAQAADSIDGSWSDLMTYTRTEGWVADAAGATATESVTFGVSPEQYVGATITDPTDLTSVAGNRFYRLKVNR